MNGLADDRDPAIIEQMRRKHPACKQPIDPLSPEELQALRKGIDRATFIRLLWQLKTDVSPGLGCLRNEHLLALLPNSGRQVTPSATAVIDEYLDYTNAVVKVQMPSYFFKVLCCMPASPSEQDCLARTTLRMVCSPMPDSSTLGALSDGP